MNSKNPNHPKKGCSTLVEPIRTKAAIRRIKKRLYDSPRNHALFVFGINTAYRAQEILSVRVSQVRKLKPGDELKIFQPKTKSYRRVSVNGPAVDCVQRLLGSRFYYDNDFLFQSRRFPEEPIQVVYLSRLVKEWCRDEGLEGNFASHTLRKTWGHWQYKRKTHLATIMKAFGHSTEAQTMAYLCIHPRDVAKLYKMEL